MWSTLVHYLCGFTFPLCLTLTLLLWWYVHTTYTYWHRRGVHSLIRSGLPFGSFGRLFMQKCNSGELMREFYESSTEPLIGVYACFRPMIIVRDPELAQRVMVTDFQYFSDRSLFFNPDVDPMSNNLILAKGESWKKMRHLHVPAFTISKLKGMTPILFDTVRTMEKYVAQFADTGASLEVGDVAARYTINAIATTAFGVAIDCFANPNDDFYVMGRKFFELTLLHGIRNFLAFISPNTMKWLRMRFFDKEICDFMVALVTENLRKRECENVVRKDFFQLLVQIRNEGSVGTNSDWSAKIGGANEKQTSVEELAAQAYFFLLAGHETSAALISFCLYEIALNPNVQEVVHAEIDQMFAEHGGITWDALSELKYLECCMHETLRKYPPLAAQSRECTKDYRVPGTNIVIEKGTPIMIACFGMHYDAKFYPDPEKFIPERFAGERKTFIEQPWLPFGLGPKACVGYQMGMVQSKAALVSLLHKYEFALGPEMLNRKLEMSKRQITPHAVGGLHLKITSRKHSHSHSE